MTDTRRLHERRLRAARARVDTARRAVEQFHDEIRDAARDGMTVREIGDAVGLSHQRVHQILHGR